LVTPREIGTDLRDVCGTAGRPLLSKVVATGEPAKTAAKMRRASGLRNGVFIDPHE